MPNDTSTPAGASPPSIPTVTAKDTADFISQTACKTLMGHGRRFSYRDPIRAIQMSGPFLLPNGDRGVDGDWMVLENGVYRRVSKADFEGTFRAYRASKAKTG